jgi:hypothetical protein
MNLSHLEEAGETYFQHLSRAFILSLNLFVMSIVCLVHSLLPFIFTNYVSDKIREINSYLDQLKK